MPKQYKFRKTFTFDGKRYTIRADTERELYEKMALKKRDLEEGKKTITKHMLVRDWAQQWLETYKMSTVSAATYQSYLSVFRCHILPYIGHMQLSQVKAIHVQQMLNRLSTGSQKMISRVYQLTWSMFDAAEANGLLIENPAARIRKPTGTKKSRRAITDAEREATLRVLPGHPAEMLIKLSLYCGLRPGESIALQWRNIDLKNKVLHVEQAAKRTGEIGPPKTSAGIRDIPIPDGFAEDLKRYKKISRWRTDPYDFVVLNSRGGRMTYNSIRKCWLKFKNDMNIAMGCDQKNGHALPPFRVADDLVLYCFRHTFCTDLQDAGVPITVAKELMGHSDISVTAKIYTHGTDRSFEAARKSMNAYHDSEGVTPGVTLSGSK